MQTQNVLRPIWKYNWCISCLLLWLYRNLIQKYDIAASNSEQILESVSHSMSTLNRIEKQYEEVWITYELFHID